MDNIDLTQVSFDELAAEMCQRVDRFEVIDHSRDFKGRCYTKYNCRIELAFQDGRRTLKVFVVDKE